MTVDRLNQWLAECQGVIVPTETLNTVRDALQRIAGDYDATLHTADLARHALAALDDQRVRPAQLSLEDA